MPEPEKVIAYCAECGEPAGTISFGPKEDEVVVSFVTATHLWLGLETVNNLRQLIAPGREQELYAALYRISEEWVSFFCEECNRSYCKKHWNPQMEFDDDMPGWYDCTYGTCPQGHRKLLDD